MTNPIWPDLTLLPGVAAAVEAARAAVTDLRRHPAYRRDRSRGAAAASLRAARASAALDGSPLVPLDAAGGVIDPVLAGALRVAADIEELTRVWERAPLQALARLHMLAAADLCPAQALGRPRPDSGVAPRLAGLAELASGTPWPGPVMVAVVHGELLALSTFGSADGVVARGAARLVMRSSGLDPDGLGVPEVAHLRSAARYARSAAGFATGTPAGVAAWIADVCDALVAGGREGRSIADAAS